MGILIEAYTRVRRIVDETGLSKIPVLGNMIVPTLGSVTRKRILRKLDVTFVEVKGQKMFLGSGMRANSERYADPFFYYVDFRNGNYEKGTTRIFETMIAPGMVVVDVGAHVGYYSLIAAQKVGQNGRVVSFEPNPSNYQLLCKNLKTNNHANVTPVQMAVAEADGSAEMYFSELDSQDHSLYHIPGSSFKTTVMTTSLDSFLNAADWPRVDFIKIDAEGAEPRILRGMVGVVKRMTQMILVLECNPITLKSAGSSVGELVSLVLRLGFTISVVTDDGPAELDQNILEKTAVGVNLLCAKS